MDSKKYLPSKKFIQLLMGFVVLGVIFLLAYNFSPQKKFFFFSKKDTTLSTEKSTLNTLIQRDTDGDGVPDWEETLWETDKNNKETFGVPDLTYITNKKKTLGKVENSQNLNETDKFAKDFFTAYTAMKTSGDISNDTINSFSNALGQEITNSTLPDQYGEKDITLKNTDEPKDQQDYYIAASTLFEKYKAKGVGSELESAGVVASGGDTVDNKSQNNLIKISEAYQEFSKKLALIPVPKNLANYHLQIINNANDTGIAILNMSKMMNDPIVGISGISQYEKYSDDLITSVKNLETFLSTNDIISSGNITP